MNAVKLSYFYFQPDIIIELIYFSELPSPPRKRCLNIQLPKAKERKFWSAEETKWLKQGVKAYGEGNWSQILKAYNFVGRTSVHLKDRWRNLQRKHY